MCTKISNVFINDLLAKIDIIKFIGNKISLKKKGKNYYGICPFHEEKTPSFSVNQDRQFYYCFGCGVHGNVIDFVMNYEKLGFVKTIEELSRIYELKYPGMTSICQNNFLLNQKKKLYQLLKNVSVFYQDYLNKKESHFARQYLKIRGFTFEVLHRFSVGFSPSGWKNLLNYFLKLGEEKKKLELSGMLVKSKNGNLYDRFRERIMFPIKDRLGRVVAFGGRSLYDKNIPKYLNSSETKIFQKSRHLYGLYEATKIQKRFSEILVVEGYLDVITLSQFGIFYVVALLGVAITKEHINLLFQTTNIIICCYDGDKAGNFASWRTLQVALPYLTEDRHLKFIFLPKGEDPDSLIRKEGKEKFINRIKKSINFLEFFFKKLILKVDLSTYEGKIQLIHISIPLIRKIKSDIIKLYFSEKLGNLVGIFDTSSIFLMIEKGIKKTMNYEIKNIKPTTMRRLVSLLIQNPGFSKFVSVVNFERIKFLKIPGMDLFFELVDFCNSNIEINSAQLLEQYRHSKFFKGLKKLTNWNIITVKEVAEKVFQDSLRHLFKIGLDQRFRLLIEKERKQGLSLSEKKEVYSITMSQLK